MLNLYIGRAGSGKTTCIYDELQAIAKQHPAVAPILLVPEQFSFETERTLLDRLGTQDAAFVKVYSFTRLADRVAKEVGGIAKRRLSDTARILLISQAIESVRDRLMLYEKQINNTAFAQSLLQMIAECKQCTVTPEQLSEASESLGDGILGRKAQELSLIFAAYEALVAENYADPLDDLSVLAGQLTRSTLLKGTAVYIDGFKGFTAQELAVIKAMLPYAASVTVALCTPTLQDDEGGYGLFSPVIHTADRLCRLADEAGVSRTPARLFNRAADTAVSSLMQLESEAFSPAPTATDDHVGITLTSCPDIYGECAAVARRLRQYLREGGYRARDMAVVMRQPDSYACILDEALRREGVPFYWDRRDDLLSDPLSALIFAAVRIAVDGFSTDWLLPLMKTGLCGFSAHSIALLENYAYLWDIDRSRWENEWTMNPAGLTANVDEDTPRRLWYLNLLRTRLIRPLAVLRKSLREPVSGEEFSRAVWRYLNAVHADRLVRLQVARLQKNGEWDAADRQARLWDIWTGLLDTVATALGRYKLTPRRLLELLTAMIANTDMGRLPAGLDGVQVGAVDRVRLTAPRVVCILGANEGVFPAYPPTDGLLTDHERRALIGLGLPMAEPADMQAMEERFYAYTAMSAPSEKLDVYWQESNQSGEKLTPSAIVQTIRQIFPTLKDSSWAAADGSDVQSVGEGLQRMGAHWHHPTVASSTLYAAIQQSGQRKELLNTMQQAAVPQPFAFADPENAKALFGKNIRLSPTQLDKYYGCRFSYFCRYGLGVVAPRPAKWDSMEVGKLAHDLMEKMVPVYRDEGWNTITRERVTVDARRCVETYVDERMGGAADKGDAFAETMERLAHTVSYFLWHVVQEFRQSKFVPVDFELRIGGDGMIPATVSTLPDGSQVQLGGIVDRVDLFEQDGRRYVRVVDYKTGSKKFRLQDIVDGINLQMLIYLFAIWDNGTAHYGEVTPAGVLYLPTALPIVEGDRDIDDSTLHKKQLGTMKMNGLLLDEPSVLQAMEWDMEGIFIPAKLKKDGQFDAHSSVASLKRLGLLKKKIEKLLTDMIKTLHSGDVAALPAESEDPCRFCDYHAVCRHEKGDPTKPSCTQTAEEIWTSLENEENSETF